MGGWTRRKLLQWNNSNRGFWKWLACICTRKHNASCWWRNQQIQGTHIISQHNPAFKLSEGGTHTNIQETMESAHSRAISKPQELCWLCTLVYARFAGHLEWITIYKTLLPLVRPEKTLPTLRLPRDEWIASQGCNGNDTHLSQLLNTTKHFIKKWGEHIKVIPCKSNSNRQ